MRHVQTYMLQIANTNVGNGYRQESSKHNRQEKEISEKEEKMLMK